MLYNKTLKMTAPSRNICFVSLESKCFPRLRHGKTSRFSGNKTDVSLVGNYFKVYNMQFYK